jgi:hypothetical protein
MNGEAIELIASVPAMLAEMASLQHTYAQTLHSNLKN